MKKFWTPVLCLISILGVQHLSAAGTEKETWKETKARLAAEGWKQVSDSVFERQRTETQVERLAYGREGLVLTISELKGRLKSLQEEYQSHPSDDLAKVIDNLTTRIENAREELRAPADGISSMSEASSMSSMTEASTVGCSRCSSVTVDAYPLTSSQGVGAVADASFSSSCGNSGNTYAFAYARATLNGTTTTKTQEDPRSGSNATSHAAASVNGSVDCFSEAYASTESSDLGISYSTTEANYSCPPLPTQPLSASISGTDYEYFAGTGCRSRTWSAGASGGSSVYTYQWYYNGSAVGTGSTYTRSVCATNLSFQLRVVVTDSTGATAQDTHDVTVEKEPMCGQYVC
jgi:hypothetical protein